MKLISNPPMKDNTFNLFPSWCTISLILWTHLLMIIFYIPVVYLYCSKEKDLLMMYVFPSVYRSIYSFAKSLYSTTLASGKT